MAIGSTKIGFWFNRVINTITPSAASVNEGNSLTVTVNSTEVRNGTLYWTVEGVTGTIDTSDMAMSGSFTVTNGIGSFSIGPLADTNTEGAESFLIRLRKTSTSGTILATSSVVTINDTSLSSITSTITPGATSVDEGSPVTVTVTTANFAGTTLFYTVESLSGTVNANDLSPLSGSVTLSGTTASKTGSFVLTMTSDATTEGAETFRVNLRTTSVSGPIISNSSTITINDTSMTPQVQFPNAGFESGLDGWTVINSRISLNGGSTIQGAPTPTDPLPTPFLSPGDAVPSSSSFNYNLDSTDVPPSGGSFSLRLLNSGNTNPYALLYGPAVYSTNTVIANAGDKISFWWRAIGSSDAYNIFAYLVDPTKSGTSRYIQLIRATAEDGGTATDWAEVSIIITPQQVGNYYFVFVNGSYDASGGQVVGAELKIDMIQRYPAGTY